MRLRSAKPGLVKFPPTTVLPSDCSARALTLPSACSPMAVTTLFAPGLKEESIEPSGLGRPKPSRGCPPSVPKDSAHYDLAVRLRSRPFLGNVFLLKPWFLISMLLLRLATISDIFFLPAQGRHFIPEVSCRKTIRFRRRVCQNPA